MTTMIEGHHHLYPALAVAIAVITGCGETVTVGAVDSAPVDLFSSCSILTGEVRPMLGLEPSTEETVVADDSALFYFRATADERFRGRAKLMRLAFPNGPESILAEVAKPGAVAVGGGFTFWIDGQAILREAPSSGGATRVIDRKGGIHATKLAATARGDIAFARQYSDGNRVVSTLWRRLAGGEPEALAIVDGRVTDIFLTEKATLLVSPSVEPGRGVRLFLLGQLRSLARQTDVERLGGTPLEPLAASPAAVHAFDGAHVYYFERESEGDDAPWRLMSMSLASGEETTLARSKPKQASNETRKPRSLLLRGDELVWVESDEGRYLCSTCEQYPSPYAWAEKQTIRSVPKAGGETRTIWSVDARIASEEAVRNLAPVGCQVAVLDKWGKLVMVLR